MPRAGADRAAIAARHPGRGTPPWCAPAAVGEDLLSMGRSFRAGPHGPDAGMCCQRQDRHLKHCTAACAAQLIARSAADSDVWYAWLRCMTIQRLVLPARWYVCLLSLRVYA
jgi:hypothetical protein